MIVSTQAEIGGNLPILRYWTREVFGVAWAKPQHPRNQVDKAGKVLVNSNAEWDDYFLALTIINNWRAAHN